MDRDFDFLVFGGRFAPLHNGHVYVINKGLKRGDKILVLLGSSFAPRTDRNPFTFAERAEMFKQAFGDEIGNRIILLPIGDYIYDDPAWINRVKNLVSLFTNDDPTKRVGLIGHSKDHTSYYLKMFPEWGSIEVANHNGLNATDIRESLFDQFATVGNESWSVPHWSALPNNVRSWLNLWRQTDGHRDIMQDRQANRNYRSMYGGGPFLTADALVTQAGHILLIKRSKRPGLGLWALPGGFVNRNDPSLMHSALRELREETEIDVSDDVLIRSKKWQMVFDDPYRDPRARIITNCFHFDLDGYRSHLADINAADDAAHAEWVPIDHISSETMFGDHYHIIRKMLGGQS